jgi:glycosyltransferase involved in cell wall biosynthesis
MKILVVQESDWLKRNPHQQHHLMERLYLRGHIIRVIDYDIDWKKHKNNSFIIKRQVFFDVHKINPDTKIQIIRPASLRIALIEYVFLLFAHQREILHQIEDFKPDVIVAFGILNAYLASRLANIHQIPFIYYWIDALDTLIPEKKFQWLGRYLERKTIAESSKIIAINKKLLEKIIEMGADRNRTLVLGAGIDTKRFDLSIDGSIIRQEYGIKKADKIILFMGFLYHFSGLKEVITEFAKSRPAYQNIKFMIIGDGDAFDDLKSIIVNNNLQNQVILTGKQSYEKIPQFIAASDICCLPADPHEKIMQDIVPIKMYEYMAMKRMVITTELPGIMKEFGQGNGVVYVKFPEDTIKKAHELFTSNTIEKEGYNARKFIENRDWSIITDLFEKTLKEVIINK